MSKSGPYHQQLQAAQGRLQRARFAAALLEPGAENATVLTELREAQAAFDEACNPVKLALDYFPEGAASPPAGS